MAHRAQLCYLSPRSKGKVSIARNEKDMIEGARFPDKKVIAELTAKMLLEVEAVRFDPKTLDDLGITTHRLATSRAVLAVAKESGKLSGAMLDEVEKFMRDPPGWSKAHGGVAEVLE